MNFPTSIIFGARISATEEHTRGEPATVTQRSLWNIVSSLCQGFPICQHAALTLNRKHTHYTYTKHTEVNTKTFAYPTTHNTLQGYKLKI